VFFNKMAVLIPSLEGQPLLIHLPTTSQAQIEVLLRERDRPELAG
jgi:hypothetical protein